MADLPNGSFPYRLLELEKKVQILEQQSYRTDLAVLQVKVDNLAAEVASQGRRMWYFIGALVLACVGLAVDLIRGIGVG